MDADELKAKTKQLGLEAIRLTEALPRSRTADVLGRQLMRSATSIGANYRAACRARSSSEFIAKLGLVEEEADETIYWIGLIADAGLLPTARARALTAECEEILRIIVASIKTARSR